MCNDGVSLEANANAAGLSACFSTGFGHHFSIKPYVSGCSWTVSAWDRPTMLASYLLCLLASVASLKSWNAVLVNDKHTQSE